MPHNLVTKLFLSAMILFLIYVYSESIWILASFHLNTDIMLSYLSGKMLNMHIPGYHFSQEYLTTHDLKTNLIANLSPPFSVMLTAFIARYLSYQNFFIAFMSCALLLNILALTRLYQHFYTNSNRLILIAFLLGNLFYWPTFMNTTFGQVAVMLNVLVIACYLSLEKKHFIRAGFFLALAINIKLFFGIFFLYFLAKKYYSAFFSFLLFSLFIALIPLCIYGASIYQGYFEALNHVQWFGVNWNASWYGFFARILGEESHRFHSALFLPKLSKELYYCFFFMYIAFIYYFSRTKKNAPLTFAFTLSSMLLISPLGWSYYFPILITSLLINVKAAESNRHYVPLICILLFSLFLSALPYALYRDTKTTSIILVSQGNLFFIALLLFNMVNFIQLLLPHKENQHPTLTKKIKLFVFSICLLPSIIGMSGIFISIIKGQPTTQETTPLATITDLLPSNHD